MKAGLQLRTAQNLSLTPQLQQSIRLLQISTLDMQQEIDQMLADNPFLEQDTSAEDAAASESEPDAAGHASGDADASTGPSAEAGSDDGMGATAEGGYDDPEGADAPDTSEVLSSDAPDHTDLANAQTDDWSAVSTRDDSPATSGDDEVLSSSSDGDDDWDSLRVSSAGSSHDDDEDEPSAIERAGCHESLQDCLHRQALALRLDTSEQAALYFLIESLDDDGYLEDTLGELAQSLQERNPTGDPERDAEEHAELLHHLTMALRLLQSLDPVGVGARDLAECLQLQLRALDIPDADTPRLLAREVALDVCRQPLDYLARRDVRGLGKLLPYSAAHLRSAMQLIATLEPKPGRAFAQTERNIVIPDVLVRANQGRDAASRPWSVQLNPAVMPRVRVQEMYASALRHHKGEGIQALQQRLQEARWMVKSIQQRFDTILRVSTAIVERQHRFFEQGVLAMEPLVLREIADELGLHESTVSRVTSAKYMSTPWGTFELKYFFASGLASENGSTTSSTAVRAMIEKLIADEPPAKPLSDNRLCELLQDRGVQCARRTVAKYREALRIPPAHLRKVLG